MSALREKSCLDALWRYIPKHRRQLRLVLLLPRYRSWLIRFKGSEDSHTTSAFTSRRINLVASRFVLSIFFLFQRPVAAKTGERKRRLIGRAPRSRRHANALAMSKFLFRFLYFLITKLRTKLGATSAVSRARLPVEKRTTRCSSACWRVATLCNECP